jgi:hypothetical protein
LLKKEVIKFYSVLGFNRKYIQFLIIIITIWI